METDLIIVREYCQKSHVDPSFIVSLEEDGLIDIREVDGDIRLFDSLTDKQDLCLALSYRTGQRTTVRIPYLFELRARY